ncbi:hypothetical protein [Burkholderia mallei]|uniref:hypothetical protein n=1 Tax=Burkholderia mallei TaxID=13373 RepID=UPI001396750F|nr:hypothetical protein [Burkholderia mallei]
MPSAARAAAHASDASTAASHAMRFIDLSFDDAEEKGRPLARCIGERSTDDRK